MRRSCCVVGVLIFSLAVIVAQYSLQLLMKRVHQAECLDSSLPDCARIRHEVGDPMKVAYRFAEFLALGRNLPASSFLTSPSYWRGRLRMYALVDLPGDAMPLPYFAAGKLYIVQFEWRPVVCASAPDRAYRFNILTDGTFAGRDIQPYQDMRLVMGNQETRVRMFLDPCARFHNRAKDWPLVYSNFWENAGPRFEPSGSFVSTIPKTSRWIWVGMVRSTRLFDTQVVGFALEPAPAACVYFLPPFSEGRESLAAGWIPSRFPLDGVVCTVWYSDGSKRRMHIKRGVQSQGEFSIIWHVKPRWIIDNR